MKWTDDFLDEKRKLTDPNADELVARLVAEKGLGEARELFDVLIRNLDLPISKLPDEVRDFLKSNCELPAWADDKMLKESEDFFLDHGPLLMAFLYFKSLPVLYGCAYGARVLAMTGRLVHTGDEMNIFSRRIGETGQFLLKVMDKGAMRSGGSGVKAAQKIRLIHASIRHFIPKNSWDNTWGEPINQEDLAMTLLTFSILMLEGLDQVGVPYTDREGEAYIHRWKVIGFFLGIEEDLFPSDIKDAKVLLGRIITRQTRLSEAGTLLTRALISYSKKVLPGRLLDNSPEIFIRHLGGDYLADLLNVDEKRGCMTWFFPKILMKMMGMVDKLEELSPSAGQYLDKVGARLMLKMLGVFNPYKQANFEVPLPMQKRWGLNPEAGVVEKPQS